MSYLTRRVQADELSGSPVSNYSAQYSTGTTPMLNNSVINNEYRPVNVYEYTDFLSGPDRMVQNGAQTVYGTTPGNSRADAINNFFNTWTGAASGDQFVPYRADLALNIYEQSRETKASSYQDLWPAEYKSYVSGDINSNQLFQKALYSAQTVDRDTIGSDNNAVYNMRMPSKAYYSFNTRGGGSISSYYGTTRW